MYPSLIFADIVTARCLLYLASCFAEPSSLKLTKFDKEISFPFVSERTIELMPEDRIVNDHYGDVLWQLNRKMQASYFWKNVLELEDTEEKMKKDIKNKLLNGPNKI